MEDLQYPPPPPTTCRYCGGHVQKMSQKEFYGEDYGGGAMYACRECGARVGTHKGTGKPLGLLADNTLNELRSELHELFDPMWKENRTSRQEAYDYFFGGIMSFPPEKRHIAMLDKGECRRAIKILEQQEK